MVWIGVWSENELEGVVMGVAWLFCYCSTPHSNKEKDKLLSYTIEIKIMCFN